MNAQNEERIRAKLLEQRQAVLEEWQRHHRGSPAAADPVDPVERAEMEVERSLEHQIAADDGNLLAKIDLALKRLDEGTYETCESCSRQIPLERLLAKPSVSLCQPCQDKKEQGTLLES